MTTGQKLTEAGVKFTTEWVMSNGFHGTRYNFPTLRDVRAAEKATGISVRGKRGSFHFILF